MALDYYFQELAYQTYLCDFRLFIEGVEVTKWLMASPSWSIGGTGSINQLNFQLINAEDNWILTPLNLAKSKPIEKRFRKTRDFYDESPKKEIFLRKDNRNIYDEATKQWLYPLNPYTPIFHNRDCVRLFIRNPLTKNELWMPAFTGFIEHHPLTEDYLTGNIPISFSCFCLKGIMKHMRVAVNPLPSVAQPKKDTVDKTVAKFKELMIKDGILGSDAGMYQELLTTSALNHVLGGKTFTQAMYFLLLGETALVKTGLTPEQVKDVLIEINPNQEARQDWYIDKTKELSSTHSFTNTNYFPGSQQDTIASLYGIPDPTLPAPIDGYIKGQVGRLKKGYEISYPGFSLERWHNLALFGYKEQYLTPKEVDLYGKATVADNLVGSPWNGLIHILTPPDGTSAIKYLQVETNNTDFSQGFNYSSRYEIIDEFNSQLDYQWYVSPIGDVIFEFPMFDFEPPAFGKNKNIFIIDKHAISASMEDEAGDIPAAIVVTGTEATKYHNDAKPNAENRGKDLGRLVIYSNVIARRLGASQVETISAPVGVGSVVGENMNRYQQEGAKGLQAWGNLQYQKRLGESSTLSMPLPFRPWLLPNRPFYHVTRERMGITGEVSHSIEIDGECSTDTQLIYVKTRGPDGAFRYFSSGGANMPINYANMFNHSGDHQNSAISTSHQIDPGTGNPPKPYYDDTSSNQMSLLSDANKYPDAPQFGLPVDEPGKITPGMRFGAPRKYRNGTHMGIDMGKDFDPIKASADGRVVFAGRDKGYGGNMMILDHKNGWQTKYCHMKEGTMVKGKTSFKKGDIIGKVGNTGGKNGTFFGPHLHFQIEYRGTRLDPEVFLTNLDIVDYKGNKQTIARRVAPKIDQKNTKCDYCEIALRYSTPKSKS